MNFGLLMNSRFQSFVNVIQMNASNKDEGKQILIEYAKITQT